MSTNFDAYFALSTIAVALTGFVGVIVVLKNTDQRFSRVAAITILGASIGVMLFAYVPELLRNPLGPEMSWRVAAGTFGLYHLFLLINHQARQLEFRPNSSVQLVVTLFAFVPIGLKLAVGLGFLLSFAYEISCSRYYLSVATY